MLTNDPNVTLLTARQIIDEKALMDDPAKTHWGRLPTLD